MSNFDETLIKRLTKLEREVERLRVKERPVGAGGGVTDHGALTGLADNDHPQYLLTSGKAADSDKLDGVDSTGFVNTTGTQTVDGTKTFSSIPVLPASNPTTANQAVRKGYADGAYLGINGKAADSDKLDGIDSTGFATAGHDHNAAYLGISAKAADSDKLDGIDSTDFGRPVFLTTPLTSTSWDGDTKGEGDRAIVDLSTVFGVPAGVKAVMMSIQTQGDAANDYIRFGPDSGNSFTLVCRTQVAGQIMHASGIVPCDANGDVYCHASGPVEGVWVWIWGYWL